MNCQSGEARVWGSPLANTGWQQGRRPRRCSESKKTFRLLLRADDVVGDGIGDDSDDTTEDEDGDQSVMLVITWTAVVLKIQLMIVWQWRKTWWWIAEDAVQSASRYEDSLPFENFSRQSHYQEEAGNLVTEDQKVRNNAQIDPKVCAKISEFLWYDAYWVWGRPRFSLVKGAEYLIRLYKILIGHNTFFQETYTSTYPNEKRRMHIYMHTHPERQSVTHDTKIKIWKYVQYPSFVYIYGISISRSFKDIKKVCRLPLDSGILLSTANG